MKDVREGLEVPLGLKLLLASGGVCETHWTPMKQWTSETAA